jgi:hypothetical protein
MSTVFLPDVHRAERMIIRRKHTANYTTIGNALFNDERLKADELGVLAFLLSRPHHWEVRRPALQRRFKIGRDLMRRILRNLIQLGWVRAELARRPNGTICVEYEVRDEPGPELTADEARSALSLESSDAGPGESCDDGMADESAPEPGSEADPDPPDPPPAGDGSPLTGQPSAAGRLRQIPPGILEKNDSAKTESENARPDFCGIGETAGRIADALLAAKSLPPDALEAIGLRYQAQAWLNAGIPADFVMAVATRVIGKRPKFPHLNYLDKAVRGAWDDHRALPAASPSREKPHETSRSVIAAADRALDRLAAEIERRSAQGSGILLESGTPPVRTIPEAGSG